MSAGITWSDVLNAFVEAIQSVLKAIGDKIKENAATIAEVLMIGAIVGGVVYALTRIPFVSDLLRRAFGAFL